MTVVHLRPVLWNHSKRGEKRTTTGPFNLQYGCLPLVQKAALSKKGFLCFLLSEAVEEATQTMRKTHRSSQSFVPLIPFVVALLEGLVASSILTRKWGRLGYYAKRPLKMPNPSLSALANAAGAGFSRDPRWGL